MDTLQRQAIDRNLKKLLMKPNETTGFSDIYAQDFSEYLEDIKLYLPQRRKKYASIPLQHTTRVQFVQK